MAKANAQAPMLYAAGQSSFVNYRGGKPSAEMDAAFLDELSEFFSESSNLLLPEFADMGEISTDESLSPVCSPFNELDNEITKTIQPACNPKIAAKSLIKSKDAQRRSEYRERERKMREDLRQQVDALSTQLDTLLRTRNGDGVKSSTLGSTISLSMWIALAIQQRGARLVAETEQRKLRAAVESRAGVILDLHGFVRKRVAEARLVDDATSCSTMGLATKRMRTDPINVALFDVFTQQLEDIYAQTETVMESCGMTSIPCGVLNFKPSRKTRDKTEFYEYAWKQVIPFDLQHAGRVLWEVAHMVHRQEDREVCSSIESSGNTIAAKFRIKSHPTSSTVSLTELIVVRRYDEKDRIVLVWKSLIEGEQTLSGMHSDKTGWCILRPLELGTIKETYVRQVPIYFNRDCSKHDVSQFTILIHRSSEEDGLAIAQALAAQ